MSHRLYDIDAYETHLTKLEDHFTKSIASDNLTLGSHLV